MCAKNLSHIFITSFVFWSFDADNHFFFHICTKTPVSKFFRALQIIIIFVFSVVLNGLKIKLLHSDAIE